MAEQLDVVTKTYDLALWLLPQVAKFPRSHRFTLGERMESAVLDVLEDLVEAQYTPRKLDILRRVNLRLERLRFLVRLAKGGDLAAIRELLDRTLGRSTLRPSTTIMVSAGHESNSKPQCSGSGQTVCF